MENISKIFNNREISIFIWVVLFLLWFFSKKEMRKSAISVIQVFFKLAKWYLLMLLYIAGVVLLFYKLELWDFSLLKNTIYWSLGSAFILFFNVNKALENEKYFFKIFKDCLNLIIVVGFLTNLYSFNIFIELVSIPILFLTGAILAFPESKPEYKNIHKIFNGVLILYGFSVIVFSVIQISGSEKPLFTTENLKLVLFGPIMTLLLIPFLYVIALYMAYEAFLNLKKFILKENRSLYRFLKWRIIWKCHLSLKRIKLVSNKLNIYTSIDKQQIITDLNLILKK